MDIQMIEPTVAKSAETGNSPSPFGDPYGVVHQDLRRKKLHVLICRMENWEIRQARLTGRTE
jgi:hypothetical protein